MKKSKKQNISLVAIAVIIIFAIVVYNYNFEQNKQKGFQFGKELEQIQDDVKQLQTKFYSQKTSWEEGNISKEELLKFYEEHLVKFKEIISKYDKLESPELFRSSVELLKLSSQMQLESDSHYVEWIKTGDKAAKVRSDAQFQESLEYEMLGLVEFYSAKTGVKSYDETEKFDAPEKTLTQRVIQITDNMKNECDKEFKNESGVFDTKEIQNEWINCIDNAEKWKTEHLP